MKNKQLSFFFSIAILASIALLVWAIWVSFWLQQFSMSCDDIPYQIMNAIDHGTSPQSILSSYLMSLWGRLFGFGILSMRYFMVILCLLTAIVACAFHYRHTHKLSVSIALVAVVMVGSNYKNIIGWDGFTNLFTTIIIIYALYTLRYPEKTTNYIMLGTFSAINTFCRMPNVVAFPVILFLIWIVNRKTTTKQVGKVMSVYLSSSIIAAVFIILLSIGSFSAYYSSWKEYGLVSGHGFMELVMNYLAWTNKLLMYFAFFFLFLYFMEWIMRYVERKGKLMAFIVYALFVIIIAGYTYKYMDLHSDGTFMPTHYLMISLFFFIAFCQMKNKKSLWPEVLVVVILSLVPPAGSDLGLEKALAIFALPIILAIGKLTKCQKTIVIGVSAAFILYLIPGKRNHTLYDAGFPLCTATIDAPLAKGIYTSPKKAKIYNGLLKTIQLLDGEIVFVGKDAIWLELLIEHRPAYATHIFKRKIHDQHYVNATIQYIEDKQVKNVIVRSDDSINSIDEALLEHNYHLCQKDSLFRFYALE